MEGRIRFDLRYSAEGMFKLLYGLVRRGGGVACKNLNSRNGYQKKNIYNFASKK